MNSQARAILAAQVRCMLNYLPRSNRGGAVFGIVVSVLWYGMWMVFAALLGRVLASMSDPAESSTLALILPGALLLALLYWQLVPLLTATTGVSLDIKRLRVYPIPHGQLFSISVLLTFTSGIEMLLMIAGAAAGLGWNPRVPFWAPAAFAGFVAFNLFVAAGTREVLTRLFARKRVREVAVFLLVLVGAVPQLLLVTGLGGRLRQGMQGYTAWFLPWSATALLVTGKWTLRNAAVLLAWVAGAYLFGRRQFERGLQFDADAARSTSPAGKVGQESWLARAFYGWPGHLFRDPLAALVEKEIRFLSRAPRFRLVFTMGFTFGLIVWLPIAARGSGGGGFMRGNYLTLICGYALLLLSDVCFWNTLGFDRRAAQFYFVAPVGFDTVLAAKNIAALFWVLLEITAIVLACSALRMPVDPARLVEAYLVTLVITLYLMAVGNLTSTYGPRGQNPEKSMRSGGAGRMQALLMVVYPIAGLPIALAYGARYAFESEVAFYIVLAIAGGVGAIVYWVARDSAVTAARERREQIVERLAQGEDPMSA